MPHRTVPGMLHIIDTLPPPVCTLERDAFDEWTGVSEWVWAEFASCVIRVCGDYWRLQNFAGVAHAPNRAKCILASGGAEELSWLRKAYCITLIYNLVVRYTINLAHRSRFTLLLLDVHRE